MERMCCRLILLPSGCGLRGGGGIFEPAGSLPFARLQYGGVMQYRILPSSSSSGGSRTTTTWRRAGERTERKTLTSVHVPSWVQYGGAERRYGAVDMGPAMVLEYTLSGAVSGTTGTAAQHEGGRGHDAPSIGVEAS